MPYCENCGNEYTHGTKFCEQCGVNLTKTIPENHINAPIEKPFPPVNIDISSEHFSSPENKAINSKDEAINEELQSNTEIYENKKVIENSELKISKPATLKVNLIVWGVVAIVLICLIIPNITYNGSYTLPNGNKYIGELKNGKANGQGTLTLQDGDTYTGEFKSDKKDGNGTLTLSNGILIGTFKDDTANGKGTFTWPDGTTYVGEFKNNNKEGYGTWKFSTGQSYVGEFSNDMPNGYGTYTYTDGTIKTGQWKDGNFVGN